MTPTQQKIARLLSEGMARSDIQRKLRCQYIAIDAVAAQMAPVKPARTDRFQMAVPSAAHHHGDRRIPVVSLEPPPLGLAWGPRE